MAAWRQIGNAAVRAAGALFALSIHGDFKRFFHMFRGVDDTGRAAVTNR
jgi:hypothetical protein